MKNELVRWAKPPVLVSPELIRQKDSVRFVDKLWIYWPFVLFVATLPWFALSIAWVAMPLTMQTVAQFWLALNSFVVLFALAAMAGIAGGGTKDPLSPNGERCNISALNYEGRRKLCQLERNRKRAVQGRERRARYPETDRDYAQFSVWPEPTSSGVKITVVEHLRPDVFHFRRAVRVATDEHGRLLVIYYEIGTSFEALLEHQQSAEKIADQLEARQYGNAVHTHEAHRNALMLRR